MEAVREGGRGSVRMYTAESCPSKPSPTEQRTRGKGEEGEEEEEEEEERFLG